MFGKSDAGDEIEVGIKDFLREMPAEDSYDERHDAFDDEGVTFCTEVQTTVGRTVTDYPHATLTTVDEMLFGLFAVRKPLLFFSHVDEQLVTVHPVFQFHKLFYYFILYFVDGHNIRFC